MKYVVIVAMSYLCACCTAAAAEADPIRLRTGENKEGFSPEFSHNGLQVAFGIRQKGFEDGERDIFVMGIDGTNLRQLTTDPADDTDPTWSPDGSHIAFASERAGLWDVYVIEVNDLNLQRITTNPGPDLEPSWSPDGSAIAYVSGGDIYTIEPQGTNRTQITDHEASSPLKKSAIGKKVIASSYRPFLDWLK